MTVVLLYLLLVLLSHSITDSMIIYFESVIGADEGLFASIAGFVMLAICWYFIGREYADNKSQYISGGFLINIVLAVLGFMIFESRGSDRILLVFFSVGVVILILSLYDAVSIYFENRNYVKVTPYQIAKSIILPFAGHLAIMYSSASSTIVCGVILLAYLIIAPRFIDMKRLYLYATFFSACVVSFLSQKLDYAKNNPDIYINTADLIPLVSIAIALLMPIIIFFQEKKRVKRERRRLRSLRLYDDV